MEKPLPILSADFGRSSVDLKLFLAIYKMNPQAMRDAIKAGGNPNGEVHGCPFLMLVAKGETYQDEGLQELLKAFQSSILRGSSLVAQSAAYNAISKYARAAHMPIEIRSAEQDITTLNLVALAKKFMGEEESTLIEMATILIENGAVITDKMWWAAIDSGYSKLARVIKEACPSARHHTPYRAT